MIVRKRGFEEKGRRERKPGVEDGACSFSWEVEVKKSLSFSFFSFFHFFYFFILLQLTSFRESEVTTQLTGKKSSFSGLGRGLRTSSPCSIGHWLFASKGSHDGG